MPGHPLEHVSPNQPLEFRADAVNLWNDAADDYRKRKNALPIPRPSPRPRLPCLTVLVRNDTNADLPARSVLRITGWVVSPVDYPFEVADRPVVSGDTPDSPTNFIVILTEPIPRNRFGDGVLVGAAVVDVLVNDESHTHAIPIEGDSTRLSSANSGFARIIDWQSTGTTRRALVSLGDPPGRLPNLQIRVRNDEDGSRPFGSILTTVVAIGDTVDDPLGFLGSPTFSVLDMSDVTSPWTRPIVILAEDIDQGQYGWGIISGIAVCDVVINSQFHTWAVPNAGDYTKLTSASSGRCRILWTNGSSGTQRCVVEIRDDDCLTARNDSGNLAIHDVDALWFPSQIRITVESGNTLRLYNASATGGGFVSSGEQTFTGDKDFTGTVEIHSGLAVHGGIVAAVPIYIRGTSDLAGDLLYVYMNSFLTEPAVLWQSFQRMAFQEGNVAYYITSSGDYNFGTSQGSIAIVTSEILASAYSTPGGSGLYSDRNTGASGLTAGLSFSGGLFLGGEFSSSSSGISDFTEAGQDATGAMVADSPRVSLVYDDGTPSLTADLIADSITAGYLHASATDVLFGRSSAGAGAGQEITCTSFARSILDDADAATVRATIGAGAGDLLAANNLSDVANAATARTNLGLGGLATQSAAADVGALSDSTGGTADTTLQAISGTGDDATLNDNFADLVAQFNTLRSNLQSAGIMA